MGVLKTNYSGRTGLNYKSSNKNVPNIMPYSKPQMVQPPGLYSKNITIINKLPNNTSLYYQLGNSEIKSIQPSSSANVLLDGDTKLSFGTNDTGSLLSFSSLNRFNEKNADTITAIDNDSYNTVTTTYSNSSSKSTFGSISSFGETCGCWTWIILLILVLAIVGYILYHNRATIKIPGLPQRIAQFGRQIKSIKRM